jgi:hypothetical protein
MTDMMGSLWMLVLVAACLVAVSDWRKAVFIGILIDVLRDPVRKLVVGKPIAITLSGAALWLLIVVVATVAARGGLRRMLQTYPRLRSAFLLLLFAMIPAAMMSVFTQPQGLALAAIGTATYLIPVLGVGAGYAFARNRSSVLMFMRFYVIVNSVALIGVVLQYLGSDFAALGGIDFKWIRYRDGYTVDLMCGWYRSPDIMGLHAAHVIMFSLLLAAEGRRGIRGGWLVFALWAAFCVIVSGRRKMIGVPLVFVASLLTLAWYFGVSRIGKFATIVAVSVALGGGMGVFVLATDQADDYTEYASSLFTEGAGRTNDIVIGSTISTLTHVGILGGGLGSATQGRYYFSQGQGATRGWQEDGVSRLFAEFGVFGVVLLVFAILQVLWSATKSLRMLPPSSDLKILQLGLFSIVVGNIASFCISHQQYSGDPVNALVVTLMVGMAFAVPALQPTPLPMSAKTSVVPVGRALISSSP